MVKVRQFQGFVCKENLAQKLIAFPYDVIDTEEAREIAKGNEYSFLHVNKPEIDLPVETNPYGEEVYQKGKENLDKFIEKGWIEQEKVPIMYIYSQKMMNMEQFGILLEASIDEYQNNLIKKHELTRKKKEDDRTKITDIQNANIGPVFLAYQDSQEINKIVDDVKKTKPHFDVSMEDNTQHTFWKCSQEQSQVLVENFKNIGCFYIADGHHRTASAYNVGIKRKGEFIKSSKQVTGNEDFNWFMALAYPQSQLNILDYNRVLKELNGKSQEQVFKELDKFFILRKFEQNEDPKPKQKGQFSLFIDNQWHQMTIKPEFVDLKDPVKSLDVQILTDRCLEPIFGIKDIRNDERIDFVGGIRGIQELEKRCNKDCKAAIAVYPVQIQELFNVSDADMIMPPKSTWFEPKPRSGCIVRMMKE